MGWGFHLGPGLLGQARPPHTALAWTNRVARAALPITASSSADLQWAWSHCPNHSPHCFHLSSVRAGSPPASPARQCWREKNGPNEWKPQIPANRHHSSLGIPGPSASRGLEVFSASREREGRGRRRAADPGAGVWASCLPSSPSHHPGMLLSDEEGKAGFPVGTVPVPGSHPPLPTLTLDGRGPGLEGLTSTPLAPGAKSRASGWCF